MGNRMVKMAETLPYFSRNRDDTDDWYSQGYEAALARIPFDKLEKPQKQSRLQALRRGYLAGEIMRRSGQ